MGDTTDRVGTDGSGGARTLDSQPDDSAPGPRAGHPAGDGRALAPIRPEAVDPLRIGEPVIQEGDTFGS